MRKVALLSIDTCGTPGKLVEVGEGLFHKWGYTKDGETCAVIELVTGNIILMAPERVRFLDREES